MVINAKLSTITAAIATITVVATMGFIGGIGQQQVAVAYGRDSVNLDELKSLRENCEDIGFASIPPGVDLTRAGRLIETLPRLICEAVPVISPFEG